MPRTLIAAIVLLCFLRPGETPGAESGSLSPYRVRINLIGQKNAELRNLLRSVSTLAERANNPPSSGALLESFARDDAAKMEKVLRSLGYYAGTVRFLLKEEKQGKPTLTFSVMPGPPFLLDEVDIKTGGPALPSDVLLPSGRAIGLVRGDPGTAETVVAAGDRLLAALRRQGYPFAELVSRRVVVDYDTCSVDVSFNLLARDRAVFGNTTILGLKDVARGFVLDRIPWVEGEFYNPDLLQQFRDRLSRSGLFSIVLIDPVTRESDTRVGADDTPAAAPLQLPITVTLEEIKPRTLGLMAGYSTDLGFGAGISWENCNLFGKGESFRAGLSVSEKMILGDGRFVLPFFLHPDQSLTLSLQPIYDKPQAYTSYRIRGSGVIRRIANENLSFSGGLALTQDNVKQLDREADFTLLSLPLHAEYSVGGQQPLARGGGIFSLAAEPYQDLHTSRFFLKTLLNANLLYRFIRDPDLRAVGSLSLGTIPESSPGEVPADLRFYAGGVNSIRGYAYQSVSPLAGKDPVGGRSLMTFSFELDQEIFDHFGAAVFIDGGSAFAETLPQFNSEIVWGTGAGLRYFSPIGPIGLDIGFPLNKRKGIDNDFQVYVSIAQIF